MATLTSPIRHALREGSGPVPVPKAADLARSVDRYSSLDSSDTFLSCNTHPFPSQGSLAGLEELAAKGSMAPNGSMPAVNIGILNNPAAVYVNPLERRSRKKVLSRMGSDESPPPANGNGRRVRIAEGNNSSEEDAFEDCAEDADEEAAPKHKRARMSSQGSLRRPRFEDQDDEERQLWLGDEQQGDGWRSSNGGRPSYMPTRGLAAVLNQGLQSLGEKLGKGRSSSTSSTETIDLATLRLNRSAGSPGGEARTKSILKKSEKPECAAAVAKRPLPPLLNRSLLLSGAVTAYYSHTHSQNPQKTDSGFFFREDLEDSLTVETEVRRSKEKSQQRREDSEEAVSSSGAKDDSSGDEETTLLPDTSDPTSSPL